MALSQILSQGGNQDVSLGFTGAGESTSKFTHVAVAWRLQLFVIWILLWISHKTAVGIPRASDEKQREEEEEEKERERIQYVIM